jgi:hypothetical protein
MILWKKDGQNCSPINYFVAKKIISVEKRGPKYWLLIKLIKVSTRPRGENSPNLESILQLLNLQTATMPAL